MATDPDRITTPERQPEDADAVLRPKPSTSATPHPGRTRPAHRQESGEVTIGAAEMERAVFELEVDQRLRGWIANSYAQIEFILGDLILRCREFQPYDALTRNLPHGAQDRVKRVRNILAIDGPIAFHGLELSNLLDEFDNKHETRNLLAHGFCTYLLTPKGETGLQFQKWHRHPDRIDARLIKTFRMSDLECEMNEIVDLSQRTLKVFYSLHAHFGWVERPNQ